MRSFLYARQQKRNLLKDSTESTFSHADATDAMAATARVVARAEAAAMTADADATKKTLR